MKRLLYKQKHFGLGLLCILLIFSLLLIGCESKSTDEPKNQPGSDQSAPAEPQEPSQSDSASFPQYSFPDNKITFKGYDAASDTTETYTYNIPDPAKATLNTILTGYNELYVVPVLGGTPITANTITIEDKSLKIDFTSSIYGNYGSGTEAALLDNLLLAFFENVPEIEEIYIGVEGGPYETGHNIYSPDDAILRSDIM
jgi:hypothetical protein